MEEVHNHSVDAPSQRKNSTEALSISNHHNLEEVNSCHDRGSRMTESIGSVKFASEGDNFGKELQCTTDSSRALDHLQVDDPSSPTLDGAKVSMSKVSSLIATSNALEYLL
ncbi:hypothetical protein ACFE04_023718 [Oxalis oulophora]